MIFTQGVSQDRHNNFADWLPTEHKPTNFGPTDYEWKAGGSYYSEVTKKGGGIRPWGWDFRSGKKMSQRKFWGWDKN